jgi:hypothetical protein
MHETKQKSHMRRAFKRLRGIIRANFGIDNDREAHLTLTYRGAMHDTDKLQRDIQAFIRGLRKYWGNPVEYVAIMEPHGHGGWHIHMLLKSDVPLWHDSGVVGLCYDRVRHIWRKANGTGHGSTRHERLPSEVRDYGSYFAAYFSTQIAEDIELSGDREAIAAAAKAAVKGNRLKHYPAGFNFYRASRGIVRPKSVMDDYDAVVADLGTPRKQLAYAVAVDADNDTDPRRIQFIQTVEFHRRDLGSDPWAGYDYAPTKKN